MSRELIFRVAEQSVSLRVWSYPPSQALEEILKFDVHRADLAKLRIDFNDFIKVCRKRSGLR